MMIRHIALAVSATVVLGTLLAAGPAAADRAPAPSPDPTTIDTAGERRAITTPLDRYATPYAARISSTIYLERCKSGCVIRQGNNDARTNTSSIPKASMSTVGEFADSQGEVGTPGADEEWRQIVQCMQEVYSPYNVTVTDVKPTSGTSYHLAVIAGNPVELDLDGNVLGVAPLSSDCSAIDNVISFTFANHHNQPNVTDRVQNICWTAAQESAHAFGLDHEYSFSDNRSACNDPMTYRTDCGGQKFFRNEVASCGETKARACMCGATQNSHLKVLSVFGPGSPTTGNPTLELTSPAATDTALGRGVAFRAGAKRGVARVDVLFNGYKWAEAPGAAFSRSGQPNPSMYTVLVPADLPNSVVDVQAIAYDDLGAATESAVLTVTKGAPCADASTCAAGQKCAAGKCFWDAPAGEIGDRCSFAQFCKSGLCTGTASEQICTQACIPGSADSCPSGLSCVMSSANAGVCFFDSEGGGCCSVDRSGGAGWVHGGIAALVLGFLARRRKR